MECGVHFWDTINATLCEYVWRFSYLFAVVVVFSSSLLFFPLSRVLLFLCRHKHTRMMADMHQKTHVRNVLDSSVSWAFTHTKWFNTVPEVLNLRWLKVWWKLFEKWMIDAQQCYICNVDVLFLSLFLFFSFFYPLNWWWWWLSWKIAATWSTQSCTFIVVFFLPSFSQKKAHSMSFERKPFTHTLHTLYSAT